MENLRRRQGLLAHNPAERPLVISVLHKEERIRALVFCTMVAVLVFALLELLARCAALTRSGTTFLAQLASVSILVLAFQDGSTLRRLSGLAPPLPTILEALGFPPAERYVTGRV
ncbi:MAG: hypothetical protein M1482_07685 [Chloroflexi bacterium]|nr:hypothetical protein [Chloroflexota bacterium]